MSGRKEIPNLTGMSPEQIHAVKDVYDEIIAVLRRFELRAATGTCAAVEPDFVLNGAMSAVIAGAKHWQVPAKDLLGNQLAATCATEEEAQLAVAAAFEGRRRAEAFTGVGHGPSNEQPEEKPS